MTGAGVVVDEVEVLPSDPPQRPTSVPQALQQNMPLASVSACFTLPAHCYRQTAALAMHACLLGNNGAVGCCACCAVLRLLCHNLQESSHASCM